jgi:hypothetical protein
MNNSLCATGFACVCLAIALLLPATGRAQLTEASLKGTVVDSFGQVVPGSAVTVRHLATGTSRAAQPTSRAHSSSQDCRRAFMPSSPKLKDFGLSLKRNFASQLARRSR